MKSITIESEYITLGQFLKLVGLIESGGEAKAFITVNLILVDDEVESRRGRKLRPGNKVSIRSQDYVLKKR